MIRAAILVAAGIVIVAVAMLIAYRVLVLHMRRQERREEREFEREKRLDEQLYGGDGELAGDEIEYELRKEDDRNE